MLPRTLKDARDELLHDDAVRPVPPRFWWLKRLTLAGLIYALLLVALRLWWGHEAQRRLDAEMAHWRAAGFPTSLADLTPPPLPDDQNAAAIIVKAASLLPPDPVELSALCDRVRDGDPNAVPLAQSTVTAAAPALQLIRTVRSAAGCDWQVTWLSPLFMTLAPGFVEPRAVSQRLCLAALVAHHEARDGEACEHFLDALAVNERVTETPFMMAVLIGNSLDAFTVEGLAAIASDLRIGLEPAAPGPAAPVQVRALIDELLDEAPLLASARRACWVERLGLILACNDIAAFRARGPFFATGGRLAFWPARLRAAIWGPAMKLDGADYLRTFTDSIAVLNRATWRTGPAEGDPAETRYRSDVVLSGLRSIASPLSAAMLEIPVEHTARLLFESRARRRLTALALAIRWYECDQGQIPPTLDALVPDYLSAVPPDPFDPAGAPLRYVREGRFPRVYSVWLDGQDDRGAFTVDYRARLHPESADWPVFITSARP